MQTNFDFCMWTSKAEKIKFIIYLRDSFYYLFQYFIFESSYMHTLLMLKPYTYSYVQKQRHRGVFMQSTNLRIPSYHI